MAITAIENHILFQIAQNPELKNDVNSRQLFEERFPQCSFDEQYQLMSWMFSNILEPDLQYWIMERAASMMKSDNAQYRNSKFKTKSSMVEFFIRNFSYGETETMRTTIWALMK